MSISLQRLRYFHAIVSGGSFSSAARNLGIAQPALSYHIADMEKTLGAKLLVRSTRGVRLTESGTVNLQWKVRVHCTVHRDDRFGTDVTAAETRKALFIAHTFHKFNIRN